MVFLIFLIGSLFGSFFLVWGTRVPKGENAVSSRSKCDYCGHILNWYELIPILSYVIQFGKCRNCGKKINPIHLIIEIVTGLLFLIGYLYFGLCFKYYIYLVSISVALLIFITDFKYMIILDSPLVIGSILILIIRYFELGINGVLISLMYGVVLFITMYIIRIIGNFLFKKESLGGGDIKLSFFIGLVLGYSGIGYRMGLISFIFSAFLALPYALTSLYLNKKNELPYGPFLISSMIIVFVFFEKFSNLLVFFNY